MNIEHINELTSGKYGDAGQNIKLNSYTTLNIGGPADLLIKPETEGQISKIVKYCKKFNIPLTIIGNGSNLIIRDKGIRGVVLLLKENFSKIIVKEKEVIAQSGALLRDVAKKTFEKSLTGMEALSGIPGSVGGGIIMNAGAYGTEIKDVVKSVKCMNSNGEIIEYTNEQMNFSYRKSKASEEKLIVVEVTFLLENGNYDKIIKSFEDFDYKRSSKQPLEAYSAGSTFKRPEGHFASKLIDDAGLRGYTIRNAMVSEKHCGFLINKGNSTCENYLELISQVQKIVKEKFGVTLEREVKLIGEE